MSLNRVNVQGRLVADPEIRTTNSGVPVANIRIAVERNYKDQNGQKESDFFSCTAWRGTAEFLEKYFHKGEQILIDGKLQNSTYTDKDGNNRTVTQIMIDSVFFCGGKSGKSNGHSEQAAYDAPSTGGFEEIDEDSIPF